MGVDMSDDFQVTRSSGNVFADLGLPDADQQLLKARFAMVIGALIEQHGLSQTAAATRIGISQPDVSKLLKGRLLGFSLDRLMEIARTLGTDIEIKLTPTLTGREGCLRLRTG